MTEQLPLEQIKQTRGETIRFRGEKIADNYTDEARQPPIRMEIWRTAGGALIAVTRGDMRGEQHEDVRVRVVAPRQDAEQGLGDVLGDALTQQPPPSMRFEVMEHFNWDDRARSMVRKQLGWKLVRDVA